MDPDAGVEPIDFLDVVWGKTEGYVDVPSKIRGHWMPFMAHWPQERPSIRRRIASIVEGESVYFSVAMFQDKARRMELVQPTHWLWADLDVEDPVGLEIDGLLPSLAWESSPGRYQAMWRLDRAMKPELQTKLNRRLTYVLDADHGGYDLTQVLRPVGTFNYKYKPPAEVTLMWYMEDLVYTPRAILDAIVGAEKELGGGVEQLKRRMEDTVRAATVGRLSARTRRLLQVPEAMIVEGERSHRLWELECLLAEQGLEEDQIVELVRSTAWNKWRGLRSEERQLLQDARKAVRYVAKRTKTSVREDAAEDLTGSTDVGEDQAGDPSETFFVSYNEFLEDKLPTPRWLIEDVWAIDSHGFIGGEPKVSKSTFSMAMALAVASGKPFLGKYKVPEKGPVLLIQEENAPWMVQDRLKKLAHSMGLMGGFKGKTKGGGYKIDFPPDYPLFLLNNYGFDLTSPEDLEMLDREITRVSAKLVILDPFYLMMGAANINNQHEVGPLLKLLTAMRYEHNCAIAIVHHWAKYNENTTHRRPGQRLIGTAIQHGWVESGIYMAAEGYNEATNELEVKIEREFRNSPPRAPLSVKWCMGQPGELDLSVEVFDFNMNGRVAEVLHGLGLGRDGNKEITLNSFAQTMDVDKIAARKMIDDSEDFSIVAKKWGASKSYRIVSTNGS